MAKILLEGMSFYAHHGCFEEERKIGTRFEAECTLEYDASAAAGSDNLHKALDYQQAYNVVAAEMAKPSALLEHVAKRVLHALHDRFPELERAEVKISKLQPPLGGNIRKVSVVMGSEEMK
ncbi:MAG: dihydroneopterin aldolase [Bacteroidales bacterium]|nr:dihydroneopterin aldolase [Bacteroidales bacterium]